MTQTERNYAQIEKEMLAIFCGYEKFDQFIYGHKITVETDHKPLVSISQKPTPAHFNTHGASVRSMWLPSRKIFFAGADPEVNLSGFSRDI